MSEKTWKRRERQTAAALKARRIPVTGIDRYGADIETPILCVQQKHGRSRPSYLQDWLSGICGTAKPKAKVGIVVWSANNEDHGDAIVMIRLRDFEGLYGRLSLTPPGGID